MRCPKCQYISFDSGERCRNCGYDFSLIEAEAPLDLPISTGDEPVGPMADLQLGSRTAVPAAVRTVDDREADADRSGARRAAAAATVDLPLFTGNGSVDAPLVTPPAVPRPPLSVRRGAPVITRPRPQRADTPDFEDEPELDLDLADDRAASTPERVFAPSHDRAVVPAHLVEAAPAGARLFAAGLDLLIVGSIDVGVVYLTLRLLGLTFADARALPPIPLGAFLLLLNGGYAAIFTTAGGQTIGKMIAGIRVVRMLDTAAVSRVPFDRAVVRSAAYLVSLLPAGLGFIVALFSADGRALHDKVAETRVIRA
jgi:uncharacterized RDD family membrane protein YckC